jgi:Flp pilus assembly CpaF family ATPase
MDNLTIKIKKLNDIYRSMRNNFNDLKKMFNNQSLIKEKILLIEQLMDDVYMTIKNKIDSDEINDEFLNIVKGIRKGKK